MNLRLPQVGRDRRLAQREAPEAVAGPVAVAAAGQPGADRTPSRGSAVDASARAAHVQAAVAVGTARPHC